MSTAEIPAGNSVGGGFPSKTTDQPEPEPAPANHPAASEKKAEAEGKNTIRQRVLIGSLFLIVVAIAVIGTVLAVVPESSASANTSAKKVGPPITDVPFQVETEPPIKESPFEVELPLFSANITEPYVSIEHARNDIEQLAKSIL